MKYLLYSILLSLSTVCSSQIQELEYRSMDYYFNQVAKLEYDELVNQAILIDSNTISEKYIDKTTDRLNEQGFEKYVDIKVDIYQSFFKHYLYLQHIKHGNNVFVLYFKVAGFDDIEWNVIKWSKDKWKNDEKLATNDPMIKVFGNYDEGPKNLENIKIFIKNDYLVFERGNLYHSLLDLRTDEVLYNEESPWHASNSQDKEKMNDWIRENLHNRIEKKLAE